MKTFELMPHNQRVASEMKLALETCDRVGTYRATGTGKSYIIRNIAQDYPRVLILAPSKSIIYQYQTKVLNDFTNNLVCSTYQSTISEAYKVPKVDLIVVDEYHRLGAPRWNQGYQNILDQNKNAKVIGLTATPVRGTDKRDMSKELFGDNIVEPMTLPEAWSEGILRTPIYVGATYDFNEFYKKNLEILSRVRNIDKVRDVEKELKKLKLSWEKSGGVAGLFRDYLHKNTRKLIIFFEDIESLKKDGETMKNYLIDAGYNPEVYTVHSKKLWRDNKETLAEFNKKRGYMGKIKVLFCVDMITEGIHVPEVDSVVFLRKTYSNVVFLQQLGRCMNFSEKKVKHPVVIDLVMNIEKAGKMMLEYREQLDKLEDLKIQRGERDEKNRVRCSIKGFVLDQILVSEKVLNLYRDYNYYEELAKEICESKDYQKAASKNNKPFYKWILKNKNTNLYAKEIWGNLNHKRNIEELAKEICESKDYQKASSTDDESFYIWILKNKNTNLYAKEIWENLNHLRKNHEELAKEICKTKEYWRAAYKNKKAFYSWVHRNKDTNPNAKEIWENLNHLGEYEELAKEICKTKDYQKAKCKKNKYFYNWVVRNKDTNQYAKEIWENSHHRNKYEKLAWGICKTKEYWKASVKANKCFYAWVRKNKNTNQYAKEIWENLPHR
jgi:superfamily II DNA or RNA helicase